MAGFDSIVIPDSVVVLFGVERGNENRRYPDPKNMDDRC